MSSLLTPPLRRSLGSGLRTGLGLGSLAAHHLQRIGQESQQGSRRNAMVACTAAAARRAEREEVEDYLLALAAARRDAAAAHG